MNSHHLQYSFCMMSYEMEYPFGQFKSAVPSQLLAPFTMSGLGSVQHCLAGNYKHWCIINIVFLLEPKQHHTRYYEENNSIPAETMTGSSTRNEMVMNAKQLTVLTNSFYLFLAFCSLWPRGSVAILDNALLPLSFRQNLLTEGNAYERAQCSCNTLEQL